MLTFRRLLPSASSDVLAFRAAFRRAPSFVYATGGRAPSDQEISVMMNTIPPGHTADSVFIFELLKDGNPMGCVFMVRGYPNPSTAYLVLLLIAQAVQGRSFGRDALRDVEALAKSWGCT